MSTASRNCGVACGTCGGGLNAAFAPGATGGTRGHYDLRAFRHSGRSRGAGRESLPLATNAALPRKRNGALACAGGPGPSRAKAPQGLAHRAFFSIGLLRGRRLRHSPPPPLTCARGVPPRGRPP